MQVNQTPLHLNAFHFRFLLESLGPSLGLWRAAEIAALRQVPFQRPLLDLGCGDGFVMSMILPRVEFGLDPDTAALEHARRRGIYERLLPRSAGESGLAPGSVAAIVSNSVIEHIPDPHAALCGAAQLLRPAGELVITTPSAAFSGWLALPFPRYARWRNHQLQHLNLWTVAEWAEHLRRAGLELTEVRPYLRRGLVRLWDSLELLQQVYLGRRRLAGMIWKGLPLPVLDELARMAARTDLSAPLPGGGSLLRAVKP